MSKLLFKEAPMENTVIRSLDTSLEYLNDANRQIYSISVPSNFSESTNLVKCLNDVKDIRKEIIDLKNWGNDSSKKFQNALQNMNSVAILLPKTQLQVRNGVIR